MTSLPTNDGAAMLERPYGHNQEASKEIKGGEETSLAAVAELPLLIIIPSKADGTIECVGYSPCSSEQALQGKARLKDLQGFSHFIVEVWCMQSFGV